MTEVPVPVAPSPKFQLIVYGAVPPVVVAVKLTGTFTNGVDGDVVNVVVRGGGGQLALQAATLSLIHI